MPHTVVVDALFVRPCTCHYYFGDYYEARYHDVGFTSCVVYSRDNYDSIVVYERYEHRDDPSLVQRSRSTCSTTAAPACAPVPPRTLNQQINVVNNTTIINNTTVINNVTVNKKVMTTPVLVAPSKVIAASGAKVVKLDPETRQATYHQAAVVRQAALQRTKAEVPARRAAEATARRLLHGTQGPGRRRRPPSRRPPFPLTPPSRPPARTPRPLPRRRRLLKAVHPGVTTPPATLAPAPSSSGAAWPERHDAGQADRAGPTPLPGHPLLSPPSPPPGKGPPPKDKDKNQPQQQQQQQQQQPQQH